METRSAMQVKLALNAKISKKVESPDDSSGTQHQSTSRFDDIIEHNITQPNDSESEMWTPSDNDYDHEQYENAGDLHHNQNETTTAEKKKEETRLKKRSRWNKADPTQWIKTVERRKKLACLPYKTKKGVRPAKTPQTVNCNSFKFKCTTLFTEEDREIICKKYWSLTNYKRQKDFILKFVERKLPGRPGANVPVSKKRRSSKSCYLMKDENKYRVCQNFFQKTLNISYGPINKAFQGCKDGTFVAEDQRGRRSPSNKTKAVDVDFVKKHFEMFPTMASHYCRKTTKRSYLDAKLSVSKMYFLYVTFSEENHQTPISHSIYRKIFCTSYNLSFFVPKKDQCIVCNKYEEAKKGASLTEELEISYNDHIMRKNEANQAKEDDKTRSENDETFMSATLDLQSVLQIPSGEETLYYCRKLCVYNLTIYESRQPNEAYCMLWSEINGKRGSNEIGSALLQWIKKLSLNIKEISLFTDTCGGQNRNQHISALLLFLVQTTQLDAIEQKILESGHSFMEVDSMHSAIEREKRFVAVNSVSDWMTIMRNARSKRHRQTANPYLVTQLNFSDMLDLKDLSKRMIKNRVKDENGNKVNWFKNKCLRYEKKNSIEIKFRYGYNGPYIILNVCGKGRQNVVTEIKHAYGAQLPISTKKKADLLKLCRKNIIPPELHLWYDSLPADNHVQELTSEPALEDLFEESDTE